MNIKKTNTKKSTLFLIVIAIALLSSLGLLLTQKQPDKKEHKVTQKKHGTEVVTAAVKNYGIQDILKNQKSIIHRDSIFSIHFDQINGIPKLLYVYKDSLTQRQRYDKFFVHVVPKNKNELLKIHPYIYINLDFYASKPEEYMVNNTKHYVFQREFTHPTLNNFLKIENVEFFNTGRFDDTGRSYQVENISFKNIIPSDSTYKIPRLKIELKSQNFEKIKQHRNRALQSQILTKTEDDIVDGYASFENSSRIKSKIRLKGDWTDHLNDQKKWSYRIILEEEKTINGMKKFSIQHPKVRNYIWERLFSNAIKQNDLIGLRYDFIHVDLIINKNEKRDSIAMGVMAIEESFDKRLIENNKRREGIILAFDESHLWNDRKKALDLNLGVSGRNQTLQTAKNLPIKVFEESRVLSDPNLNKQFNIANELLSSLQNGKVKISDVFDIDKLTLFVAISNLFGAHHGLIDHNLRIYFNPITSKFEPIAFDSQGGYPIDKIVNYPFSENDPIYTSKLVEKLELVSSSNFIKKMIHESGNDINTISNILDTEFDYKTNLNILDYNSNFIKKQINPSTTIISNLISIQKNELKIKITNVSSFPILIKGLTHVNLKRLNQPFQETQLIYPNQKKNISIELKDAFNNAFVSKKNKIGGFRFPKDVKKLKIEHQITGMPILKLGNIIPFKSFDKTSLNKTDDYKKRFAANFQNFDFIRSKNNNIIFKEGNHKLSQTIFIPENKTVFFNKGCNIDLVNNASIISYSPIIARGSNDKPIRFFSSDSSGGGIFVSGSKEQSILTYCDFNNLSNPSSKNWNLSGSINFHETRVDISHSSFKNNRCEDGVNIIRSTFLITDSKFENTFSDAFDGDFVQGVIQNSNFTNSGNDGIDISGSKIYIKNITIKNSSDKGISAGESSLIQGQNIKISDGEIGIVSKDLSTISLSDVSIENTKLGISSFQKKPEFGEGNINITSLTLTNNNLDYLIENGSQLKIDDKFMNTVPNKVINQMYGKEYGKSSK